MPNESMKPMVAELRSLWTSRLPVQPSVPIKHIAARKLVQRASLSKSDVLTNALRLRRHMATQPQAATSNMATRAMATFTKPGKDSGKARATALAARISARPSGRPLCEEIDEPNRRRNLVGVTLGDADAGLDDAVPHIISCLLRSGESDEPNMAAYQARPYSGEASWGVLMTFQLLLGSLLVNIAGIGMVRCSGPILSGQFGSNHNLATHIIHFNYRYRVDQPTTRA